MTPEEYNLLFHMAQVNLVAFKQVFHCDDELRKMVEMAVTAEREKVEDLLKEYDLVNSAFAKDFRARGETK
jgi:hypothetical protein